MATSPGFLAKETAVRHDFLLRHPTTLPGPLAEYTARTSEADLFPLAFATAMEHTAEAPQSAEYVPGYWRRLAATNLPLLPLGDRLGAAVINAGRATRLRQDEEAVNQHALATLRTFRQLVVTIGVSDAASFDAATPAAKSRSIMAALQRFADLLDYPCPYTVYLLDVDKDSDDDPAHRIGKEFVRHLNGAPTDDYANFPTYSREQQTEALRRAFSAFIAKGNKIAGTTSAQDLDTYLDALGFSLDHHTDLWKFSDNSGAPRTDRVIIRQVFGDDTLHRFESESEPAARDATRIAAILLLTQLNVLASGLLVG